MPIAFSVMFIFFPSGLVLYWLVNNSLQIFQQWHMNRVLEGSAARGRQAALTRQGDPARCVAARPRGDMAVLDRLEFGA